MNKLTKDIILNILIKINLNYYSKDEYNFLLYFLKKISQWESNIN
jgi:hypothetical protein